MLTVEDVRLATCRTEERQRPVEASQILRGHEGVGRHSGARIGTHSDYAETGACPEPQHHLTVRRQNERTVATAGHEANASAFCRGSSASPMFSFRRDGSRSVRLVTERRETKSRRDV